MKKLVLWGGLVGAAAVTTGLIVLSGRAADHIDAPATVADPSADITDLYAWTSADATRLNLILNVNHMAGPGAVFSDAVAYVIHVTSMASYGATARIETPIICKFYAADRIECWVGTEYVAGAIGPQNVLTSPSQKLRVFAGRRNDPFFFELVGFQEAVKKVVAAAPTLTFDANGCPVLPAGTSALLVKQLQSSGAIASVADNLPAKDTFALSNVLSIAIQIDKTLVTEEGPILGVWASTNRTN